VKDLKKALSFYRLAARNGHRDAAARVTQLELELNQSQSQQKSAPLSQGH
jgi:TPR repeat protein